MQREATSERSVFFATFLLTFGTNLTSLPSFSSSPDIDIDHEVEPTLAGNPPAYWPASGFLVVRDLSAKYTLDGPKVLDDVSFALKSGERCAVVGR